MPFERRDLAFDARRGRDARPDRDAVDDHRARAALPESAAEPRALQTEIVAQDVEERNGRLDVNGARGAVYFQIDLAHAQGLSYHEVTKDTKITKKSPLASCTSWSSCLREEERRRSVFTAVALADAAIRAHRLAVGPVLFAVSTHQYAAVSTASKNFSSPGFGTDVVYMPL